VSETTRRYGAARIPKGSTRQQGQLSSAPSSRTRWRSGSWRRVRSPSSAGRPAPWALGPRLWRHAHGRQPRNQRGRPLRLRARCPTSVSSSLSNGHERHRAVSVDVRARALWGLTRNLRKPRNTAKCLPTPSLHFCYPGATGLCRSRQAPSEHARPVLGQRTMEFTS
jgi:hypothetical protein